MVASLENFSEKPQFFLAILKCLCNPMGVPAPPRRWQIGKVKTMQAIHANVDARYKSPLKRAAKLLGVIIKEETKSDVFACYDINKWYVQSVETTRGQTLVARIDDLTILAAVVDDFDYEFNPYDTRANYLNMMEAAGLVSFD